MKIRTILWSALAVAGMAAAGPITFTISAFGSGTLNGNSFTDALITFTQVTDTSLVTQVGSIFSTAGSTANTVTVAGLGTATLTNSTWFFDNQAKGSAGMSQGPGDLIDETDPAFSPYSLQSSIGPITNVITLTPDLTNEPTSAGNLTVTYLSSATFNATTTTPEPGSMALIAAGAVGILALARRRRA